MSLYTQYTQRGAIILLVYTSVYCDPVVVVTNDNRCHSYSINNGTREGGSALSEGIVLYVPMVTVLLLIAADVLENIIC